MTEVSKADRASRGQLKLGAFMYPAGHHVAAWRHPDVSASATTDFAYRAAFARKAEAAKFDLIFLADGVGVADERSNILSRSDEWSIGFEPVTLLSALSTVTERIGLVATASTTFHEPYNIARFFGSLDQLSAGRAGWNLVTSSNELEARNFSGVPHLRHADRYDRANEFIDVVLGLWNSWEDGAFLRDKASGRFFDPDKLHVLDHKGRHFEVRGPLNVSRSPQGHPVVIQAGSSDVGQELAARTAEVVFTAQRTLHEAQKFYGELKGRLARYGRAPDDLKIMPGVFPVVGRTETEAKEKFEELQNLIHPELGLALLSNYIGKFDLSAYALDGPLPDMPVTNASQSRQQLLVNLARRENLTIRQLYLRVAGARGHWQLIGTAEQIADELEERFLKFGADGFNVMPPTVPGGLDDFIALVIPELRRRGLFRSEYEGRTLRENLGLKFRSIDRTNAVPKPPLSDVPHHMAQESKTMSTTLKEKPTTAAYQQIEIRPVAGRIGAEIGNVRLGGDLDPQTYIDIRQALLKHRVIFFRGQQHLDDVDQERFARLFGELVAHPTEKVRDGTNAILELDTGTGYGRADQWHTDVTFVDAYPQISILRAIQVPPFGGDTVWANTVAAYERLPEELKQLAERLWAIHSNKYDYAAQRPHSTEAEKKHYENVFASTVYETEHPLVRIHPETGEKALILGYFIQKLVGQNHFDSARLFDVLQDHVVRLENTVRWRWQAGDVAIWDNRATQHYAINDYGEQRRIMRRSTIAGDVPVSVNGRNSRIRTKFQPVHQQAAE